MSEDVPMPAVAELDPRLFEIVPFMRYDETGRFTDDGKMGIAVIEQKQAAGELILPNLIADRNTEWFDAAAGAVVPRPVLELPARLEVEAGVEAVVEGVPPCLVSFTGPLSGEQEHGDGDLLIGFTIPGTYTLRGEAFPAQPFEITLEVTA